MDGLARFACATALLAAAVCTPPGTGLRAQESPGTASVPPAAEEAATTPDGVLATFDRTLGEYATLQSAFGLTPLEGLNGSALRGAMAGLLAEALGELDSITGTNNARLACLDEIATSPPLAAGLAAIAGRTANPVFLLEYLGTHCTARLGDLYQRGKIPCRQARLGKVSGDLVVDKGKIWLEDDQGTVGHRNGYVDPEEWFTLKLGITNRSKATPYLSASATLVVLDDKGAACPLPLPGAAAPSTRPPEACTRAFVLTERLALPDLSPGEQATLGPFRVALRPGTKGPFTLRLGLQVETSNRETSVSPIELPLTPPPRLELSAVSIDDDATGESRGNGDGRVEPGESIELRTHVTLESGKELSKLGITARQFSTFVELPERRLGVARLRGGRPTLVAGDIAFTVPTVDAMAAVPADRLDQRFFHERRITLWLAATGCAGNVRLPKDWERTVPQRITCSYTEPGYQYVIPVEVNIEFGQLFAITSQPSGASILVNGVLAGRTDSELPLIFPQVKPVKNTIVYYDLEARLDGFETQAARIPVIWKDRTADNLTTRIHFDLPLAAPPIPPPPPAPLRTEPEPPPVPPEPPEPAPPEPPKTPLAHRFTVQAAPLLRFYKPHFDKDIRSSERIDDPSMGAGFELGGSVFFARNFYLTALAQLHFSTADPAARFYAASAQTDGTTPDTVIAWVDSLTGWSLALEPRFRVQLWHLLLNLGMGVQLDGNIGEAKQRSFEPGNEDATVAASVQPAAISAAARISAGIGVDTGSRWTPILGSFLLLPPNDGIDWGLVAGIEIGL